MSRTIVRAVVVAAASRALAANAEAGVPELGQAQDAATRLATKATDRMAAQCRPKFCMDANEYATGCILSLQAKFRPCSYRISGYTYVGDEPVGDFDCQRSVKVVVRQRGRSRVPRIVTPQHGQDQVRGRPREPCDAPLAGPAKAREEPSSSTGFQGYRGRDN